MTLEEKYQKAVKALEQIARLEEHPKYRAQIGVYKAIALYQDSSRIAKRCLQCLKEQE